VHHATGKSLTRHVYTVGGEPCPNNTEACFATKGIHESIQVIHDHKFNSFSANFKCGLTHGIHNTDPRVCKCVCDAHPTGCYQQGKRYMHPDQTINPSNWLRSDQVEGNDGIVGMDFRACSDACTTHPECTHWEHDGSLCHLLKGTDYTQVNAAGWTAGLRNDADESSNTCTRDLKKTVQNPSDIAPEVCPAGTYVKTTPSRTCETCPAGKYTPYPNQQECYEMSSSGGLSDVAPQTCHIATYDASPGGESFYGTGYYDEIDADGVSTKTNTSHVATNRFTTSEYNSGTTQLNETLGCRGNSTPRFCRKEPESCT